MRIVSPVTFATAAILPSCLAATSSYAIRTYSTVDLSASKIAEIQQVAKTNHVSSDIPGSAFDRFVVIWLENTDYNKAADDENMAWLAEQGIVLDNYWALTHPSEPNYLASVSGDYFALDDDRFIAMPSNISTIIDLLDTKNISWAEYQEHLPYTGFLGFNYSNQENFANDYVRKHNPLVLFDSITNDEDRLANIKNFTEFYSDLEDRKLPQYSIITPNMTNDGHDTTIKVAGQWSRNFLEPLLSDDYFMNNTAVLLTFDENETYSVKNKVFSILLGGAIPEELKGTTDSTYYDHYSQISSVEANWNLPSLGRHDATANVLQLVANATNITNEEVDTTFKLNNATYIGYLKNDQIDLPAPNVTVINKNGRGVLQKVVDRWSKEYSAQISASYFTSTTTTTTVSGTQLEDAATLASKTSVSASVTDSVTTAVKNGTSSSATSSSRGAGATNVSIPRWVSIVAFITGIAFL